MKMKKISLIWILLIIFIVGCNETSLELKLYISECNANSETRCVTEFAIKKGDIQICNKLAKHYGYMAFSPGSPRGYCQKEVALSKNDENLCKVIRNEYSLYECYSEIARLKKDEGLCENLIEYKDNCYRDAATEITTCEKITSSREDKFNCYSQVAQHKMDVQVCDKIVDLDYKDLCYYRIANLQQEQQ